MSRPRRHHGALFKARVALEALRGEQALADLAQKYDVHATQIAAWKSELLQGAASVFEDGRAKGEQKLDLDRLHAKIGQLALETIFFRNCAHQRGLAERKKMIDLNHKLSVTRQPEVFGMPDRRRITDPRDRLRPISHGWHRLTDCISSIPLPALGCPEICCGI